MGGGTARVSEFGNKCVWFCGCKREGVDKVRRWLRRLGIGYACVRVGDEGEYLRGMCLPYIE